MTDNARSYTPATLDEPRPNTVFVVRHAQIVKHTPAVAFQMQTEIASLRAALAKIADFHHQNAEAYTRTAALPAMTKDQKLNRRLAERCAVAHVASFQFVRNITKGTQR